MKFIDLINDGLIYKPQMASLLQENFISYKDELVAREEVEELLAKERICIGLIVDGILIGLIGGIPTYSGNVYELHPLVIKKTYQLRGYGSKLIKVFEDEVISRNGITVYLGSDDEYNQTSLFNTDLYIDLWDKIKNIKNTHHHPFTFYLKNGYSIVGVIPDANGLGKPDILLAKRVGNIQYKDKLIK